MTVTRRSLLAGTGATMALATVSATPARAEPSAPRTFHVANDGSDEASGLTPNDPWATLDRVNREPLRPGDRVLLRRGDRWTGQVVVTDSGRAGAPIVVGAYGPASVPRPRIDGQLPPDDALAATVLVHNAEHVHVRDLEITNDAEDEGMRNGVLVAVDAPTQPVYTGYRLENLYVHDVAGRVEPSADDGKRSGGIGVFLDGSPTAVSRFHDIRITDNVVEHVDQTGIWIDGNLRSKELPPGTDVVYRGYTWDRVKYTGVDIGHNRVTDTARNGVIIRLAEDGRFHHNIVSFTTSRVPSGNSVFTVSVYRFVVEWNEVFQNRSAGTADGCAFDPDLDSPETVWRYNYSHDNNYGMMTLCTRPRDYGIEVYQNIDVRGRGRLLNLNYGFTGVTFERNAFWTRPVPEVEYPDTDPDYVNPDRATAGGYPQLIWETHTRSSGSFTTDQTYTYRDNVVFNQAPTATFFLNPNDETSYRTTNRTLTGNRLYGLRPDRIDDLAPGFEFAGEAPPPGWIADTIGAEVYAFWKPSLEGRENPRLGTRAARRAARVVDPGSALGDAR
ncbi:MAG TPA: right-handed parallel beta-helix repeat-containing protein [Actinopolymorphaceae bacterium]